MGSGCLRPVGPDRITIDYSRGQLAVQPAALYYRYAYDYYSRTIAKTTNIDMHGAFDLLGSGNVTAFGGFNVSTGITRIAIDVTSGSDLSGVINVSGTAVDRNTGAQTGGHQEQVLVEGVTTNNTAAGTTLTSLWDFDRLYMTDAWFTGSVTVGLTGSSVNLQADAYAIAYEQTNDSLARIETVDNTFLGAVTTGSVEWGLFGITRNDDTTHSYDVATLANYNISSAGLGQLPFRTRIGDIDTFLDGSDGEGFWATVRSTSNRAFEDYGFKVWVRQNLTLT